METKIMEMSCKLFCVFVLLGCVLYVQGYHYILTTSHSYAVVGSPFTFTCRGGHSNVTVWFVNNTEYWVHLLGSKGECDTFRKPPKEYIFNCSADTNILTIKSVDFNQHETVWRCGDEGGRSNEIKLEVRGPPNLRGSAPYAISGLTFTLTCRIFEYSDRVIWFENDVTYDVLNSGPGQCGVTSRFSVNYTFKCFRNKFLVTIKAVNRNQQGNIWRCESDRYQNSSNTVVLKVRDGPGNSLRVNSSSDITVEEGSDVTVSCKADCFIKCCYRWELTNQTVSNNSLLALTNIKRFQDGVYTCTAVNPDTNQRADTKIIINVKRAVEDSSQFGNGFGSGFGIFFVLSVIIIIVVVIYFRYKKRKKKPTSKQQRISTNQPVYNSVAPVADNQTAPEVVHHDTRNPYSSLEERRNEVPYDALMFDDDQTAPAAEHQDTGNPYSSLEDRGYEFAYAVLLPDNNQTAPEAVHQERRNPYSSLEERGYEVPYDVLQSLIVNEVRGVNDKEENKFIC